MGKPKRIDMGNESSGITIEYVKSKRRLDIFGYYDHFVGIEGESISLIEFCERLRITRDDLPKRGDAK
jgi:hypothetical protein